MLYESSSDANRSVISIPFITCENKPRKFGVRHGNYMKVLQGLFLVFG